VAWRVSVLEKKSDVLIWMGVVEDENPVSATRVCVLGSGLVVSGR
jgi:hypothetical protein